MFNLSEKGKSMDNVTTVGIDLAKNVFSLHGVDGQGRAVWRRTVRRGRLLGVVAQLPRCRIGMEACSGAHQWAREFQALGHEVKLMAPKFVIPYRRGGKNDGNDAEAICEAVSRPGMRFVPVKSAEYESASGARAPRLPPGLRGDRGEECPHRVGAAGQGRAVANCHDVKPLNRHHYADKYALTWRQH